MQTTKILLVEDNEGDILLTKEAFRQAEVTGGIDVVRDGEEAVNYLNKENKYKDTSTPDLVFLDINLPKMNGKEVLRYIKENHDLMHIPVIMLTTSDALEDIDECYHGRANCYITKPSDLREFFEVISVVKKFWLTAVQLPNHRNNA